MTLADLVQSITTTLTTRLLQEHQRQHKVPAFDSTLLLAIDAKMLASIIDELARNTAQALQPEADMLAEALVLLRGASLVLDDLRNGYLSPQHQRIVRDVLSFVTRTGGLVLTPVDL